MADDGKTLVVGSQRSEKTVVFNLDSGKTQKDVPYAGHLALRGETLVIAVPWEKTLHVLAFPDLQGRGSVGFETGRTDMMRQEGVASVAMTQDASTLVFGTLSGIVGVWSVRSQTLVSIPGNLPVFWMKALTISPDGSLLAYAQMSESTITIRWMAAGAWREWVPMNRFHAHENPDVNALAFTPDGRSLVSAGEDVKLWRLEVAGEPPRIERVAARERAVFKAPSEALTIAISRDGKTLATADGYGIVALWDLDPPAFRTYLSDPNVSSGRR
jgi:WD40 repeat protein